MDAESLSQNWFDQQASSDCQIHQGVEPEPGRPVLDELFAQLNADDWSLKAVTPVLPALLGQAAMLAPMNRFGWQAGLRRLWSRHGWGMPPVSQRQLMALAYQWDDWPLVIRVGEALTEKDSLSANDRYILARAYWQLGEGSQALQLLRPILFAQPNDTEAYALYRHIGAWRSYRACYPFDTCHPADEGELRLEPLGEHHLRDFAWQYHDPAIAVLCCLPNFDSDQSWVDWLRQTYGYGDQLLFAVLHQEWGFIGSVSLILHRGVGFMYYWIGAEFQSNGFGSRAAAMMLQLAQEVYGMHVCYAKTFSNNYPSQRGLKKLGFEPMAVQPLTPHEVERFFRLGIDEPNEVAIEKLRTLLDDMGSEVGLCEPLRSAEFGSVFQWKGD